MVIILCSPETNLFFQTRFCFFRNTVVLHSYLKKKELVFETNFFHYSFVDLMNYIIFQTDVFENCIFEPITSGIISEFQSGSYWKTTYKEVHDLYPGKCFNLNKK